MKRFIQRSFFPAIVLIALIATILLANEIVNEKQNESSYQYGQGSHHTIQVSIPDYVYAPAPGREDVIVYFIEMPLSISQFASFYDVTPIFVKNDIKMVAFETSPNKQPCVTGQKTLDFIEKVTNNSIVESAKVDTYMFLDKSADIKTTPTVVHPEDLVRNGTEYVPNEVLVSFWRMPPSIYEFGAKYGGTPDNITDANLQLQFIVYDTNDVAGFINNASKDPYVSDIGLNAIGHIS